MPPFFLFLVLQFIGSFGQDACPCTVENNVLYCSRGSIYDFPADVEYQCPEIIQNGDKVLGIDLQDQPFEELVQDGFRLFPNIQQLALSFNKIGTIQEGAFNGLDSVATLILRENNISYIPDGTLDNMIALQYLDLEENPIKSYITQSWTVCHSFQHGYGTIEGVELFQDFSSNDQFGEKYCKNWLQHHSSNLNDCQISGDALDCSDKEEDLDVQGLGCSLQESEEQINNILVNFPRDPSTIEVDYFGKGESSKFFKNFNGVSSDFNRKRRTLTFYATKFDLASLIENTNASVTKEVTIKADTVFISEPIKINYNLKIRARIVSIDKKITMNMTMNQFNQGEMRTSYEKAGNFSAITQVRHRKFGLVDIVDFDPGTSQDSCKKLLVPSESLDTTDQWYDLAQVNLMYVCAATVQEENKKLALNVADFNLDFHRSREVVADLRTFSSAQKFRRIKALGQNEQAHNVPSYSIQTISDLSTVMHDKLNEYWKKEGSQRNELGKVINKMSEIKQEFELIEIEQQNYFEKELSVLEQIFAAADNVWHFNFEHRNASFNNIQNSISNTGNLITETQEQELKVLLEEAMNSVEEYEDTVQKYTTQVERFQVKVQDDTTVLKDFNTKLHTSMDNLNVEIDHFSDAVGEWYQEQIMKSFFSFLGAIVSIFTAGFMGKEDDDLDLGGIIGDLEEAIQVLKDIQALGGEISEIIKMMQDLNFDDLNDLSADPTTDFMTALKSASELKTKGPRFDELDNIADNELSIINAETDYGIDGFDKLIMAIKKVSSIGRELITSSATFAEDLLSLAERNDELSVAQGDLQRAIADVETIKETLEKLQESANNYNNTMNSVQQDYYDKIEEMKEQYEQMEEEMRQKFIEEIKERFEKFKQTYDEMRDSYLQALDESSTAVQDKIYGLNIASMTQRSMLMVLYRDFCDTIFYHSFTICNEDDVPLMGDEFDKLLLKLNNIAWDSITSSSNLPQVPQRFEKMFTIEDYDEFTIPVNQLTTTKNALINFKDFLPANDYGKQWRYRIDKLRVLALDKDGVLIQSPGTGFGEGISLGVTFPSIFNDTDSERQHHTFLAQHFYCRSTYVTYDENDVVFSEKCQVSDEFSINNYKASPDGLFNFKLLTDESILDYSRIAKLNVTIEGSFIAFPQKNKMTQSFV